MNVWKIREDRIKMNKLRDSVGVASIVEKMKYNRLRYYRL